MFKKINGVIILFLLSCIGFFLFAGQKMIKSETTKKAQQQHLLQLTDPHFWVISDNHFYADALFEDSEVFRQFEATAVGKDIRYTETVLKAFVQKALIEKPTGIILTGDITLNGEKESLDQMIKLFEPLQEAGILVLAIPGNHDIYNGWAREFKNEDKITTHQISPETFQAGFSDGYELSRQQDTHSLSYLLDLKDYRFFMLDSNIYADRFSKKEPVTHGELKPATLDWLKVGLEEGKALGKTPLFFLHHSLLVHNENVTEGFVLNNADAVLALIESYQVPLAMSGHVHLQDIMQSIDNPMFHEISTASFSTAGSHIGHLTLKERQMTYEVESFDPRPYFDSQTLENSDLKNYPTFLKEKSQQLGEELTINLLSQLGVSDQNHFVKKVGEAHVRYFTGAVPLTENEKEKLYKDPSYENLRQNAPQLLERFSSLLNDANFANNHRLVIDLP